MKYPNPCDTCPRDHCPDYRKCQPYLQRVRTIWKQFNSYPDRVYRTQKTVTSKKFTYEHPNIIRRYLANSPCAECQQEQVCDVPCDAYWRWWDARMEWLRGRWNQ